MKTTSLVIISTIIVVITAETDVRYPDPLVPARVRDISDPNTVASFFMGKDKMIDFSGATVDPETGKLCVIRETDTVGSVKDQVLECIHKEERVCHYTYVTRYEPHQEEVCRENFEKICQITFVKQAVNETVRKCYTELENVCQTPTQQLPKYSGQNLNTITNDGEDEERCKTFHETSCTTRYSKVNGKVIDKTECKKFPVKLCGNPSCKVVEKAPRCIDKQVTVVFDMPEESCDLNPQTLCRIETRLVPNLTPIKECTLQPKQVCQRGFSKPRKQAKKLKIKWCLDENRSNLGPEPPKTSYGPPRGSVLTSYRRPRPQLSRPNQSFARNAHLTSPTRVYKNNGQP